VFQEGEAGAVTAPGALRALVTAMSHRDQSALGKLYDATSAQVLAIAERVLGSRQDAEEVVLDVYMKAWRNAATYDPQRGTPMAWLILMTRSAAIDRLRQRAARPDLRGGAALPETAAPGPDPEQSVGDAERRRRICGALAALPAEQREAVELAFYSGFTHAELSARLGQPLGTIKTRIRLGLARMRTVLEAVS
jgi:RNA polymerase sigma-70 factor (ECF subfamily)